MDTPLPMPGGLGLVRLLGSKADTDAWWGHGELHSVEASVLQALIARCAALPWRQDSGEEQDFFAGARGA